MELGFDIDQVKLNDVVQAIGKLNLNSVLAATGFGALYEGLKDIMGAADTTATNMNMFNAVTGLSSQKMEQWSRYAQRFGVGADVVGNSLESLQKKVINAKLQGDYSFVKPMMAVNQFLAPKDQIDPYKDLDNKFVLLNKITMALQKMPSDLRASTIGWFGLNEQLLAVKSFDGANNIPVPTQDQIDAVMKYKYAWTTAGQSMQQVFMDIAADYAPALTDLGNRVNSLAMSLHGMGYSLRDVTDFLLGLVALNTPLGRLLYILYMILTHIKEIQGFKDKTVNHIQKIANEFAPHDSLLNKQLKEYNLNSLGQLFNQAGLMNTIGAVSRGTSSQSVQQHNTITILANDIKDLETKFTHFLQASLTKAFYQNSSNH